MSELETYPEYQEEMNELLRMKKQLLGPQGCSCQTQQRNEWKVHCLSAGIYALSQLRPSPPSNEPLTLDELREMDGLPVYVVPINQSEWICWENDGNAAYGLVRKSWVRVWREETADMQHTDFDFDDYGKTWLAYRRPPERREETR